MTHTEATARKITRRVVDPLWTEAARIAGHRLDLPRATRLDVEPADFRRLADRYDTNAASIDRMGARNGVDLTESGDFLRAAAEHARAMADALDADDAQSALFQV